LSIRISAAKLERRTDMSMIFPSLGIYGWKEADENLLLASLLADEAELPVKTRSRNRPRRTRSAHI
jgi:hypothetical protein